jgi:hypothetical protein
MEQSGTSGTKPCMGLLLPALRQTVVVLHHHHRDSCLKN